MTVDRQHSVTEYLLQAHQCAAFSAKLSLVTFNRKKWLICVLWSCHDKDAPVWKEGRNGSMPVCHLPPIPHLSSQLCSSCRSMAKPSVLKGALNTRGFFFRTPWKKVFAGPGLCSGVLLCLGCNEPADAGGFCLLIFLAQLFVPDAHLLPHIYSKSKAGEKQAGC